MSDITDSLEWEGVSAHPDERVSITWAELVRLRTLSARVTVPAGEAVPRDALATLADLRICFASWQPDVCVLGNVRAGDAVKALDSVLRPEPAHSAPAASDALSLDWITDDMSGIQIVDQVRIQAQFSRIEDDEIVRALGVAVRRLSGAQQAAKDGDS